MDLIVNSLTQYLDSKLSSLEAVDNFLDGLEDQIFEYSNREFYLKYKGDLKELIESAGVLLEQSDFQVELLAGLVEYRNQRMLINKKQ